MALDGTAQQDGASGSSCVASLTTTGAGRIFALIGANDAGISVTSVTASGLTFTQRAETHDAGGHLLALWDAVSSGAQTGLSITANLSGASSFAAMHLWGYSGISGLDSNVSNPNTGATSPRTISTTSPLTVVFGGARPSGGPTNTPGTGFTQIRGNTGSTWQLSQYAEFSSVQTGLAVHDEGTNDSSNGSLAIAYVLDGVAPPTKIQFRAAGAQAAANSTPQSPALPTGHAAGDVLLLFCSQASAAAVTFTPPAGWTSIARNSDATRAMTIEVFAKIDNGSESAPSVATSAAAAGWSAQIGAWYNVDDGFIEDATEVSSNAAAAATFQPTGITTVTANAWVLSYVCSKDDNALNYNNQNGYSDRMSGANYDTTLGNGSDQSIGVADKEFASPGAQTCPTWNQSTNGNDAWVGLTLALRPKTLVWGGRPDGYLGHSLMMQLLAT